MRNGSAWQRWHRTAGLAAAVFVVLLSVSGVALNHADALGLKDRHVTAEWLLDWYGIAPDAAPIGYAADGHWIARVGGRVYFDRRELPVHGAKFIGAVVAAEGIVVAASDELLVLASDGSIVERLGPAEGVPSGSSAIGIGRDGRPVIEASAGAYALDLDSLHWSRAAGGGMRRAEPADLPAGLAGDLLEIYRGEGLPVERVLADAHSGRLFGRYGPAVVDAAGLVFLFLAASGVWMWWRRPPNPNTEDRPPR